MSSVNKVIVVGNLGAYPEVRFTQENVCVATLSVATSEKWRDGQGNLQERTEWHRVVAWGKLAENVQTYCYKGQKVYVEGKLQTRAWEDKDKIKRYTTEIRAEQVVFLSARGDGGAARANADTQEREKAASDSELPDMSADDDLPF